MSIVDVIGSLKWRVGKPLDHGVFAVSAKEGGDICVGVFRDASVAAYVVAQHNESLDE
jgi:hypothetical protein